MTVSGWLAALDLRSVAHAVGAVLLVALVVGVLAASVPAVVGADQSFVVRSDSMSPSIEAGSVVFVSGVDAGSPGEGDVITYERGATRTTVTHRIVDVVDRDGERRFRTKGDANDDADAVLVAPSDVVGKVTFHVPYLGYLLTFARSSYGIVALVIVPSVLLAVSEVWRLYRAADPDSGGDG